MKVYVLGYRRMNADRVQPPKRPFDRAEDVEVQYCDSPEWQSEYRELAESEVRILREMHVHVGPHYCEFVIEELPEDRFAIICPSHPELRSSRTMP